jgi:hypothetical protein
MNPIRSTLLMLAVREARQYGATSREVLASFALGTVRPELQEELDTQLAALGVPPSDAITEAEQVFTGDITVEDLRVLVSGYCSAGQPLTNDQAKEISDVAVRLLKCTRRWHKTIGQAQVIADTLVERDAMLNPPPERKPQTFPRPLAHAVRMPGRGVR